MHIQKIDNQVKVRCPAKLNLYLEITGRRPDGFHELETLMQTVSIYDNLTIRPASETVVECSEASIPCDDRNTVTRAIAAMRRISGVSDGVHVMIEKNIPAGAGLAGGSSDAAGVIAGLNALWNLQLGQPELESVAASIGSDVPFFLTGGAALCRGRGEIITPVPAKAGLQFVVVWPRFELSTAEIYNRYDSTLKADTIHGNIYDLIHKIERNETESIGEKLFNRLEATALSVRPELQAVRQSMSEAGLAGVTMTGSGSAFFGLCNGKEVAGNIAELLASGEIGVVFSCCSTIE